MKEPLPSLRILVGRGTEFRATETRSGSGSGLSIGFSVRFIQGGLELWERGNWEVTHAAVVPRVAFESESGTVRPGIFLGCLRRRRPFLEYLGRLVGFLSLYCRARAECLFVELQAGLVRECSRGHGLIHWARHIVDKGRGMGRVYMFFENNTYLRQAFALKLRVIHRAGV